MKHLILIFFISLSTYSFGQNSKLIKPDLIGCWTDSREENIQNSNTRVYRPCDFKSFPVTRFRFTMDLKEDNKCSWLYLDPMDAHHMKDGTWTFEKETMTLKIFNIDMVEVKSFVIAVIGENILNIKN